MSNIINFESRKSHVVFRDTAHDMDNAFEHFLERLYEEYNNGDKLRDTEDNYQLAFEIHNMCKSVDVKSVQAIADWLNKRCNICLK